MITITRHQNHTPISSAPPRGRPRTTNQAVAMPSPARLSAALAVLRVVVGTVFLAHGAQKLVVFGFAGVISAFEGMGVPLAGITGPAVALLEFFGGLALIAGFLARLAALGLAIDMLGAIVLVHLAAGFFLPNGLEFAFALFGATVMLLLTGPGSFSLDGAVARRRAQA